MIRINSTMIDKDVYELLESIKQQLSTNWIYLHFDVLKTTEKCNCFDKYENLKQLNGDGSCTQLIKVTFKRGQENMSIYIENCKLGECSYYIIHSMEMGQDKFTPTPNPEGAIYFKT